MKRLSDLPADDRLTARAHELIRAIGPTVESEERFQRVRRSLDAPARGAAPRWMWRGGLALGLFGAGAAAAASSSEVSRFFGHDRAEEPIAAPAVHPAAAKVPMPRGAPAVTSRAEVVEAVPSSTPPSASALPHSHSLRVAAQPSSDVARVHEAARALRRDGDVKRALQLLEAGPAVRGPLAEEALALRIEASMKSGNGRQSQLASSYLERYPQGRYRELAKKALTGTKQ